MRIKPTYFFLALISWLCATISISALAQTPRLGVSWSSPPVSSAEISTQLGTFENIGVEVIELMHPVNPALLDSISSHPFEVFIRFDYKFLTSSGINEYTNLFLEDYTTKISDFASNPQVTAFGLYSYSQSFDESFAESFGVIASELRKNSNISFYEISSGTSALLDFSITEIFDELIHGNKAGLLLSKENSVNDAKLINTLFDSNTELLLFNSTWLSGAIEVHPGFLAALQEMKNGGEFVLPEQQEQPSSSPLNWPVIVFIIVWLSVGLHLKVSPNYRSLIFRFFSGHRFFVDDIMRYRERSITSGIFLFFQHAFLSGLTLLIVFSTLVSGKGLEVYYHFMPFLAVVGKNYFSVFVIGVLLSLLIQMIGIIWLYLPNQAMTHLSQVMNLYTWIFHLDFLIVSIMMVIYLSGGSSNLLIILSILYIVIWLTGFLLTSLDSSKYLQKKRIRYIFYTFGLHTIVNIGILVFVFANTWIIDTLRLMIYL